MLEFPEKMNYGECYGPAMEITDQEQADEYFEALVTRSMTFFGQSREEAESIQRQNLGYWAGYYTHKTRMRVERLFHCAHPIFGKAEISVPTAEEAYQAGVDLAKATCPKCGGWFATHNDDGSCVED